MAKSPFPGMDPYLERHWRDVHARLIIYVCDALQPRLPADLKARVEERVFVESPEETVRGVYPDVRGIERPSSRPAPAGSTACAVLDAAEPLVIRIESEPVTETYLEIVEVGTGRRVVTVEIVSPSNKAPGPGQDLYLKKQREVLASSTNLVEIDLTRTGDRVLGVPWWIIPSSHRTPYLVTIRPAARREIGWVYPLPLRVSLPVIRIPLRETDPNVALDLQAVVDRAYEFGDYDDLDYTVPPDPPLDPADEAWADALLRAAGRR